ncbi:tetratricopeptide repeat protein [Acetivibrio mesophilus]|uniref:Tetratricopeptide repeat protein n=1 Tax=Acetivibrio mesophilus TaxID=2487273 RepID=A0A4Q0I3B0_9FIRM|nr:tetratricopeptide repeat protein [Acetivibrio mesophilus]ODM27221.1 hypothetical protein A7W90_13935 [Clostridium sp. Bc-iso-3]RXE58744.1 hypothetical protein EFD62_10585 [Acetivibrio mesophilus]
MRKSIVIVFSSILAVLIIIIIINSFTFNSINSYVNSNEWDKYYTAGNQYFYDNDYKNAIVQYEQSISALRKEISEDITKRIFIFQVLLSKAKCLEEIGEDEEAMQVYEEVIAENEKVHLDQYKKSCNSYTAVALIQQGLIYLNKDEKDMADKKFTDCIVYLQNGDKIDYSTKKSIERIIEFYKTDNDEKKSKIFEGFLGTN